LFFFGFVFEKKKKVLTHYYLSFFAKPVFKYPDKGNKKKALRKSFNPRNFFLSNAQLDWIILLRLHSFPLRDFKVVFG